MVVLIGIRHVWLPKVFNSNLKSILEKLAYGPVIMPITIRTLLSIAISSGWIVKQVAIISRNLFIYLFIFIYFFFFLCVIQIFKCHVTFKINISLNSIIIILNSMIILKSTLHLIGTNRKL
jgi:hypothetical protein